MRSLGASRFHSSLLPMQVWSQGLFQSAEGFLGQAYGFFCNITSSESQLAYDLLASCQFQEPVSISNIRSQTYLSNISSPVYYIRVSLSDFFFSLINSSLKPLDLSGKTQFFAAGFSVDWPLTFKPFLKVSYSLEYRSKWLL